MAGRAVRIDGEDVETGEREGAGDASEQLRAVVRDDGEGVRAVGRAGRDRNAGLSPRTRE